MILETPAFMRGEYVISLLAVVGFVFTKMTELNLWFLGLCAFGVVLLGVGVIVLQRKILKIIKEIGEL